MTNIRCDNAECVVYVDELMREFPRQFELEISPRPVWAPAGDTGRGAGEDASNDEDEAALAQGAALGSDEREARRQARRSAGRPPRPADRREVIQVAVLALMRLRHLMVTGRLVARWYLARWVQALLEPGGGARAAGGSSSRRR